MSPPTLLLFLYLIVLFSFAHKLGWASQSWLESLITLLWVAPARRPVALFKDTLSCLSKTNVLQVTCFHSVLPTNNAMSFHTTYIDVLAKIMRNLHLITFVSCLKRGQLGCGWWDSNFETGTNYVTNHTYLMGWCNLNSQHDMNKKTIGIHNDVISSKP